jgi:hypothetical protein
MRKVGVAALIGALTAGAPLATPSAGRAEAQDGACSCYASFDAIDSDLNYVDWYYNSTTLNAPADQCDEACDGWRRNWFYFNACDYPKRINRGRNAWWGYDNGLTDNNLGPDTWWCPSPPP